MPYGILRGLNLPGAQPAPGPAWQDRAVNRGLMSAGAEMGRLSGASRVPRSIWEILSRGIGAAGPDIDRQRQVGLQEERQGSRMKTQRLLRQKMERDAKLEEYAQRSREKLQSLLAGGPTASSPSTDATSEDPMASQVSAEDRTRHGRDLKAAFTAVAPGAAAAAAFRPPPAAPAMEKVMGPNGPVLVPRSVSAGMVPYIKPQAGSWKSVADPNSQTGFSYRDMNNPEAPLVPGAPQSGMTISFDEQGKPIIRTGGATSTGMQKKTTGAIEDKLFRATENLSQLSAIAARYKPEYQQIATRWDAFLTSAAEKSQGVPILGSLLGSDNISPQDKTVLSDYASFRATTWSALNQYIKDITGAQMSEPEAKRIMKGFPDPGSGLFDGDSPTEFEAKLRRSMGDMRAAAARYNYALKKGLDWKTITLDSIRSIMRRRATQIEKQLKKAQPEITADRVRAFQKTRLAREFGLPDG